MTRQHPARYAAAIGFGLLALAIAAFGISVTYGLAVEYGGGAAVGLVPVTAALSGASALAAAAFWPGIRRSRVVAPLVVLGLVVAGGLAGDRLGERGNQARLEAGSRAFTCNGPNAEIVVDARVDTTFEALPRRAPIYGPVEGSRDGCTAAVSGPGRAALAAYADAFRGLGWRVVTDQPDRFVMRRAGVRVTLRLHGAPDQLALLTVAVTD